MKATYARTQNQVEASSGFVVPIDTFDDRCSTLKDLLPTRGTDIVAITVMTAALVASFAKVAG